MSFIWNSQRGDITSKGDLPQRRRGSFREGEIECSVIKRKGRKMRQEGLNGVEDGRSG